MDVLLVEDDDSDAESIEQFLSRFGTVPAPDRLIEVEAVDRVRRLSSAIDYLDDRTPDIVLLDLRLPDSAGIETLERVVEVAPTVPIVVVTGAADSGMGPSAIRRGAEDYLRKGTITGRLLRRTLRYAIDRHERAQRIATTNRRLMLLNRIIRRDLTNDAGMIVGYSDDLRELVEPQGTGRIDDLIGTADTVVDRLATIGEIMEVLSESPNHGDEPIDLVSAVEMAVSAIDERNDVELTVYRPTGEGPIDVFGGSILPSVFEQLLSNAVRHNEQDTPRITVTIESAPERASVAIADDGVEIPDAQKERLTELSSGNHDRSGLGTGLYLVLLVLDAIGGEIEFEDNEPRGTTVTVTIDRV